MSEIVAKQYTDWSYPKPVADMVWQISNNNYHEFADPCRIWPLIWPEGRGEKKTQLKILIAGCGTNQAAYNALQSPSANVTAIDLSMTSLQHSQFLKEKHALTNLKLLQMDLLEVEKLGEEFDLIVSTGVLHHMKDPTSGLKALKSVLAPDGMMSLMVYGKYMRAGVYMLQEAFKLMKCKQKKEDIELVKSLLQSIPNWHSINAYTRGGIEDLEYDSGIVDTFLHPQDRAYTVPEVMELADSAGLVFWDWIDRLHYSDVFNILAKDTLLNERYLSASEVERWALIEILYQSRGVHRFLLSNPTRRDTIQQIIFTKDNFSTIVPSIRHGLRVSQGEDKVIGQSAKLIREGHEVELNISEALIAQLVNGTRTIEDILDLIKSNDEANLSEDLVEKFFLKMRDYGHFLFHFKGATYIP
jgi:SAM-dependent methyltransferase